MRYGFLAGAAVTMLLALAGTALAQAPAFTFNQLPKWSGGEPSIAADPTGTGDVYVVAPQSIPSVVNGIFQGDPSDPQDGTSGVSFWASRDDARTFPEVSLTGSALGGGDSDVEVSLAHTLYVADLEAADAAICISHDRGKSFDNCNSGLAADHAGPEDDREWLTRGTKPGELYLTYHDFTAGFPIIEKSTDDGNSFSPCGNLIDPGGPAAQTYNPVDGTLVSKPVVGADGSVYVEFSTTDPSGNGGYGDLYMAVAKGGCNGQFTNYRIFADKDADFANIFQWLTSDGAGNLYLVGAGKTGAGQSATNVWLFASRDQGRTWSAPIQVNPPNLKGNALPTVTGGQAGDELSVGWFGSTVSGDLNDKTNVWRYYVGTSFTGGQSWSYTTATSDPMHYGQICTGGTACGSGNRNLLDFSSVTLDPKTGCPLYAIPGDPQNNNPTAKDPHHDSGNAWAYVGYQTSGPCLTATGAPTPASQAAAGRSGANAVCQAVPRSTFAKRGVKATRKRLRVSGSSSDGKCAGGRMSKVEVAVSRRQGHRCRFLNRKGRLTSARACSKPVYLRARGVTTWTLSKRVRLPKGTYTAQARATDVAGHVEKRPRTARLRVR